MTPMVGIPGSISDEAKRIRWQRGPDVPAGRTYYADTGNGWLRAILSQDEVQPGTVLWHLSVSHSDLQGNPDRCPTWDELKHAKYQLVRDDVPMVLIFPRRSAPYVDHHPTTLHLWEDTSNVDLT